MLQCTLFRWLFFSQKCPHLHKQKHNLIAFVPCIQFTVIVTFCLRLMPSTPTEHCAKLLFSFFWLLSLVWGKKTKKKETFEIAQVFLFRLSGAGLRSKVCRKLRSLCICWLFCYWFNPKSSLICHEPGKKPAEVSRQISGSPMLFSSQVWE